MGVSRLRHDGHRAVRNAGVLKRIGGPLPLSLPPQARSTAARSSLRCEAVLAAPSSKRAMKRNHEALHGPRPTFKRVEGIYAIAMGRTVTKVSAECAVAGAF